MVLSTTMPQASIQMDPFSQYGGLLGFALGGGLNALLGRGGQGQQGQMPPRPPMQPQQAPPIPQPMSGNSSAQQAMAIQNNAANNAAAAAAGAGGGQMGDFSPRPPEAPQPAPQQMPQQAPPQMPQQPQQGGPQQDALTRIAQAIQGQGGLGGLGGMGMGGLGGMGGAGGAQNPMQQMQAALNPSASLGQSAAQLRPQTPSYAGTGANPAVLQALSGAAMQPGRFGGPMGPAGINPYALLQRRLAGAGMSPMGMGMMGQNPYGMMG